MCGSDHLPRGIQSAVFGLSNGTSPATRRRLRLPQLPCAMNSPSMPPLVDSAQYQQFQQQQQPGSAQYPSGDHQQQWSSPGPAARWQPRPQWPVASPESPLAAGSLSPLSQFTPGWQKPPSSSSSASGSTAVVQWGNPPTAWPGTPYPGSPSRTPPRSNTWNWSKPWFSSSNNQDSNFRWPPNSSPSPPPSTPDSSRALTPYHTLSRTDSSATISSTYSATPSTAAAAAALALSTGRPPQQWRADFKMPRTGLAAIMHRKKRSLAYPGTSHPTSYFYISHHL